MDWDNLRVFLELARTQRLMEAAQRLGIDHTTVSRRIRRFEQELGTQLFDRNNQGYALTAQGHALVEYVERMEGTLSEATEQVVGSNQALVGQVRIGATEGFGSFVLAPHLAHFCTHHPRITVDLLLVPRFVNLSKREADFAITIERPMHGSYVVSRLTDYCLKLYATPGYLNARPPIRDLRDLQQHSFSGYVDELAFSAELRYLRQFVAPSAVVLRSTSVIAQHAAARRGQGMAILPCFLAQQNNDLVPVLDGQLKLVRSFWLVTPTELRSIARFKALWDYLREVVENNQAYLMGDSRAMEYLA